MLAEYAEGANAYGVFLGGDNKLFKIQNQDPAMKNGKKIAVLKESFGNAFVPFYPLITVRSMSLICGIGKEI